MNDPRPMASTAPRWPMTSSAWRALSDERDRLEVDVRQLLGMPSDPDHRLIHLPAADPVRRLESLLAVLALAEIQDAPGRAVIGRRVTIRETDGEVLTYALVVPGQGDPMNGWVSADSPLGGVLLEASSGDVVEVIAPAGQRAVTVLAVA